MDEPAVEVRNGPEDVTSDAQGRHLCHSRQTIALCLFFDVRLIRVDSAQEDAKQTAPSIVESISWSALSRRILVLGRKAKLIATNLNSIMLKFCFYQSCS